MAGNSNLHMSKDAKEDEYYTSIQTIENELKHYKECFKDKIVFCNCDDPEWSNFWQYFQLNFEHLQLKKLISTHFDANDSTYKLEIIGDINGDNKVNNLDIVKTKLSQNGDFRSPECQELLKECDIVVTNPPFSLMKEYLPTLLESGKQFLVLGNVNHVTFKEIFKYYIDGKFWLGYNDGHFWFRVPEWYEEKKTDFKIVDGIKYRRLGNICWFTNLPVKRRSEELILTKKYNTDDYQKYETYDAIDIKKTVDIPLDYDGVMGVPISYLPYHCPSQFEVIGKFDGGQANNPLDLAKPLIDGKPAYKRIAIRRKSL